MKLSKEQSEKLREACMDTSEEIFGDKRACAALFDLMRIGVQIGFDLAQKHRHDLIVDNARSSFAGKTVYKKQTSPAKLK